MKRSWLLIPAIVVVGAALAIGGHVEAVRAAEMREDTRLCTAYLRATAELPRAAALAQLNELTAPGTQARRLGHWLASEETPIDASLRVTRAHVALSEVQLHGFGSVTLHAEATVTRHFYPHGVSQVEFFVNCHIQSTPKPTIDSISVNTNPITTNSSPDPFTLNLWNLYPAAPTPHGD
ncbi:MAG: hypothetical protein OWU84_11970 [Firmicutes bacterium]|nr:hypothetical protein [Bacillota bacterium]